MADCGEDPEHGMADIQSELAHRLTGFLETKLQKAVCAVTAHIDDSLERRVRESHIGIAERIEDVVAAHVDQACGKVARDAREAAVQAANAIEGVLSATAAAAAAAAAATSDGSPPMSFPESDGGRIIADNVECMLSRLESLEASIPRAIEAAKLASRDACAALDAADVSSACFAKCKEETAHEVADLSIAVANLRRCLQDLETRFAEVQRSAELESPLGTPLGTPSEASGAWHFSGPQDRAESPRDCTNRRSRQPGCTGAYFRSERAASAPLNPARQRWRLTWVEGMAAEARSKTTTGDSNLQPELCSPMSMSPVSVNSAFNTPLAFSTKTMPTSGTLPSSPSTGTKVFPVPRAIGFVNSGSPFASASSQGSCHLEVSTEIGDCLQKGNQISMGNQAAVAGSKANEATVHFDEWLIPGGDPVDPFQFPSVNVKECVSLGSEE